MQIIKYLHVVIKFLRTGVWASLKEKNVLFAKIPEQLRRYVLGKYDEKFKKSVNPFYMNIPRMLTHTHIFFCEKSCLYLHCSFLSMFMWGCSKTNHEPSKHKFSPCLHWVKAADLLQFALWVDTSLILYVYGYLFIYCFCFFMYVFIYVRVHLWVFRVCVIGRVNVIYFYIYITQADFRIDFDSILTFFWSVSLGFFCVYLKFVI